jgi:hypothetical protein
MTSDETVTWDGSVLERVHLSNLVDIGECLTDARKKVIFCLVQSGICFGYRFISEIN